MHGNLELREGNTDRARQLYEDGINANCTDASSVYHGLAKLHLSLGEVEELGLSCNVGWHSLEQVVIKVPRTTTSPTIMLPNSVIKMWPSVSHPCNDRIKVQ